MRRGVWYAVVSYTLFGFFPLYWKALESVPALQTVAHRSLWSCVVLMIIVTVTRQWTSLGHAIRSPRTVRPYAAAAAAVAINWFIYIWAVNAGYVVQTALGYFVNPLVSVLLGVVVLRERLRPGQWVAIALAGAGVLYLAIYFRAVPWIALGLAISFGLYGFFKKTAPLDALLGLTVETSMLFLPALVYLAVENHAGRGAFGHAGIPLTLLMMGAGPATTLPLLFFGAAARRIPLSLMGMLQYINPTIQLLLGIYLYGEPFTRYQFVGFACVWAALVVYSVEGRSSLRQVQAPAGV